MQKSLDWQRMNNKGTMEQKNKLIPELRFPEFVNDGEWKINEVGNLFEITRGYVLPMNMVKDYKSNENPYPVYSSQTKNNGLAGFYTNFLYENAITWTTDGANAGDVNYREGKFYCTNVCGVLINKDGFANKCIAEIINSVTKNYVSYVGNPKLMNGVMSKIKIPVPQIKEQQKIADCLSSLDELITAHNDKLETLKNHKKGLLQNLFPQEGQTVPNYRFPEFMNDGDWEIKTVSEVAYYENGKAHEQHIIINGKYKVVNSKFISTDGEVVKYTNEALCLANINDTLMVLSDVPNGRAIAKCFYVDKNNTYTVNQRICKLKPLDINGKILYYLLNRNPYFLAFDDGVKQTNLKNDDVLNCEIVLPKKTKIQKEQQKIADCLLAVDNLITAQTEKIEQLKAHKKGLMQELFPKIEE